MRKSHLHRQESDANPKQTAAIAISMNNAVARRMRAFPDLMDEVADMRNENFTYPEIRTQVWDLLNMYDIVGKHSKPKYVDAALRTAYLQDKETRPEVQEMVKTIRGMPALRKILVVAAEDAGTGRGVLRSSTMRDLLASNGVHTRTNQEREIVGIAITILLNASWKQRIGKGTL